MSLVESKWDYSLHAKYYQYRPNYKKEVIDLLCHYVGSSNRESFHVADIGAGTGNLTLMLLERGLEVVAIEPNDEMLKIGVERTKHYARNVKWIPANGINSTLPDECVDWVTFGSSFNVMDRSLALQETYRVLKSQGFFTCMWNHRNLADPIQKIAEDTILEFIPDYDRGVRREDQRIVIEQHESLFRDILYIEADFKVNSFIEDYLNAWKSVKNNHWDLSDEQGLTLFEQILSNMRMKLPREFNIQYTTRAWTAQKAD